jgi:hypothetical protein
MTGRELLNRKMRWIRCTIIIGVVVMLLGPWCQKAWGSLPQILVFACGLIIVAGASGYAHRVCRCPWCNGDLYPFIFHRAALAISRRMRFCVYCGTKFDRLWEESAPPVTEEL